MIGVAFGSSMTYAEFSNSILPLASAAGGWVSGLGALGAVLATLSLADRQRREDVENLKVSVNAAASTPWNGHWFIAVNVVSDGRRPAAVTALSISSPHSRQILHVRRLQPGGSEPPVTLTYGERADFYLPFHFEKHIGEFVEKHCDGKASGLKLLVITTLRVFEAPIHPGLISLNDKPDA